MGSLRPGRVRLVGIAALVLACCLAPPVAAQGSPQGSPQGQPGQKRSTKPEPKKRWRIKDLKAEFVKPWWAATKPAVSIARDRLFGSTFGDRLARNDDAVMEAIRLLHVEIEANKPDGWEPLFRFRLAQLYESRGFYPQAYYQYNRCVRLGPGTNVSSKPKFPRTLSDLNNGGAIGMARVCAKVGLKRNASAFLRQLNLNDGYLLALTGEVYDMIGDARRSDSAYLVGVQRARSRGNGFGPTDPKFIRLNAVRMAFKHNNFDQAKKLAQPIVSRARDSFRWPQEKTVHDNMSAVLDLIKNQRTVYLKNVKDGTWEGTGNGFSHPIVMAVTVVKRKITEVVVKSNEEKRPFNAFTVIPERVIAAQSTKVDGIADATATVYGILAAVEQALTQDKALKRKPRRR